MATSLTLNTRRSIGLAHNHDLVIVSTADINEDRHHVSIFYRCTILIADVKVREPQTQ